MVTTRLTKRLHTRRSRTDTHQGTTTHIHTLVTAHRRHIHHSIIRHSSNRAGTWAPQVQVSAAVMV